jgi:hypothetical protein
MKVTRVTPRAVAEPGGLTYLVVRVDTDEGVSGYGETTAGPGATSHGRPAQARAFDARRSEPLPCRSDRRGAEARASLARGPGGRQRGLPRHPRQGDAGLRLRDPGRSDAPQGPRHGGARRSFRGHAAGERSRGEAGGLSSLLRPPDDAVRKGARPPVLHRHPVHPGRPARRRGGRVRLRPRLRRPHVPGRGPLDRRPPGGVPPALDGRALRRAERHRPGVALEGLGHAHGLRARLHRRRPLPGPAARDAVDVLRPGARDPRAHRRAQGGRDRRDLLRRGRAVPPRRSHRDGRRSPRLRGAAELLRPGAALLHESRRPSVPRCDQRLGREAQRRVLSAHRPARPRPRRRRARARRRTRSPARGGRHPP